MLVKSHSVYRLGQLVFSLSNAAPELSALAEKLLPRCDVHNSEFDQTKIVPIDVSGYTDLRNLINNVLRKHDGKIWVDAGCLLSPSGKRYLIVGKSSAGKSTLSMAMALGRGWNVITEDMLLIDTLTDTLFTFATPFSFKPGTTRLLAETINVDVESQLIGEWLPLGSMAGASEQPAHFDFTLVLAERDGAKDLELSDASVHEVLREIFKCSNVLHLAEGPAKMLQYLSSGRSFIGRYGTLQERMDALERLEKC